MINLIGRSPISWILDSGEISHLSVCMQDLLTSSPLQKQEVVLKVGNGATIVPLVVETSSVLLFTRHVIKLKECLFVSEVI